MVSPQDGPEDSQEPLAKAPEEEGSLELLADGVNGDSSFDSASASHPPAQRGPSAAAAGRPRTARVGTLLGSGAAPSPR